MHFAHCFKYPVLHFMLRLHNICPRAATPPVITLYDQQSWPFMTNAKMLKRNKLFAVVCSDLAEVS